MNCVEFVTFARLPRWTGGRVLNCRRPSRVFPWVLTERLRLELRRLTTCPELDRRDLLRLFYGDDAPVGADPVTLAKATHETRRMLRKHFAGFVVLEERTRGRELEAIRILQPRPDGDE